MKNITKYLLASICGLTTMVSVNASDFTGNSVTGVNDSNSTFASVDNGCLATNVVKFTKGKAKNGISWVPDSRSNAVAAVAVVDNSNADGGFVSLGYNNSLTLGFSGVVYDMAGVDIKIYETSFSGDTCGKADDEKAIVELSQDGVTWHTYPNVICRDGSIDIGLIPALLYVTQIRITTENSTKTPDGYDVDGVVAVRGCFEPCFASQSVSYGPIGAILDARAHGEYVLGAPYAGTGNNTNFATLGFGGKITVGFGAGTVVYDNPGDDLLITETTWGGLTFANYPETADVYVTMNNVDWFKVGTLQTKDKKKFDISVTGLPYITRVRIVDTTHDTHPLSPSDDGIDIDAVVALQGCGPLRTPRKVGDCNAALAELEYHEGTTKGGGMIPASRTIESRASGAPQINDTNNFVSLGYGGWIILSFNGSVDNLPGDDLTFIETSFNQTNGCVKYPEFADIYVSTDRINWHLAGTVCKENNTIDIDDATPGLEDFEYINYVKVVNNDLLSKTPDGYDLDGVIATANCRNQQTAKSAEGRIAREVLDVSSYPNPTRGNMLISFRSPETNTATIEVFDLTGRTIKVITKQTKVDEVSEFEFDGNGLPKGVYLYKVSIGANSTTKRFSIAP